MIQSMNRILSCRIELTIESTLRELTIVMN
ncbi:MAG: hypothetical protein K0R46_2573 [Herbinix sp.]|jgi:hypothetical protein|nr:hypothetical protein [Herbinix sp.]